MPLNVGEWNEYTLDDVEGWLFYGGLFVPKDFDFSTMAPSVFFAPTGGRANIPALATGDRGFAPTVDTAVTLTEVDFDDPDPLVWTWETTDPGDDVTPPTIKLHAQIRTGEQGDAGSFLLLDADDIVGTPAPGYYPAYVADTGLAVGGAATSTPGAIWTAPKVGGMYWPASISNTASGAGTARTLCSVSIAAQPFSWRPRVAAQCVIVGTGTNVAVDLIARADVTVASPSGTASTGDIVGKGVGIIGQNPPRNDIISGPPAGSSADYGRIAAGQAATIYLRAERSTGSDLFTTQGASTSLTVEVAPVP